MKSSQRLLGVALALLAIFQHATAAIPSAGFASVTIEPEITAIAAGKPFTVGVHVKLNAGWHTYWQFAGDSGLPPKITWHLPEGFKAGPIQWPLPEARLDEPDLLSFVYPEEAFLLVEITPPEQLPTSEVTLRAKVWCIAVGRMGDVEAPNAELKIPTIGEPRPAEAELFAKWRARLPKSEPPPFQVRWERSAATEFSLQISGLAAEDKVEFFPLPAGAAKPGHPTVSAPGSDGTRTIITPITEAPAANLPWSGVVVVRKPGAERVGWAVASTGAILQTSPN